MYSRKTRIAIIDDERDLCFLLSRKLIDLGFEVYVFYNLQSGLEGIADQKPDWVILDNNLPDGQGWEYAPRILGTSSVNGIINISANPDSPRSLSDKRVHYLIKPIEAGKIVQLIQGAQL